jgi:hypothetical protein
MSNPTETPVTQAYHEWKNFAEWVNSPATRGMDEAAFEDLTNRLTDHVDKVISTPSQTHLDLVVKFLAAVTDYQLFHGIEALETLEAEARALVEA